MYVDTDRVQRGGERERWGFDIYRRVTTIQHGKKIFHLTASFDSFSGGFEHNVSMPDVPGPEGLLAEHEHATGFC